MSEIKGALLKAWIDFLKERYGSQAVSDATQTLKPEDKQQLTAPFLDSSWYPYDTLHILRRLTRVLLTPADGDLSTLVGSHMAQQVFTGVYRSFLTADPIKQVEKFAWIQEFFFRETRRLETKVNGPQKCTVRYEYRQSAKPTRGICNSLLGFWSRTLELSGAVNVRAEHTNCVVHGADTCEFVFEWE